jgi:hypothetical protein
MKRIARVFMMDECYRSSFPHASLQTFREMTLTTRTKKSTSRLFRFDSVSLVLKGDKRWPVQNQNYTI